jgi:ribosomal protein S18 acetylase RimI-like enzyme
MSTASGPYVPFARGAFTLLSPADVPAIFDLYRRCADYFWLQDGHPAQPSDAGELFTDLPVSKTSEDLHVFGYLHQKRIDAVAALLAGYPGQDDWYLGLLLLDPSLRGQGLGREMYQGIEQWSGAQGAKRMLLAVLQENIAAFRFWRSLGFELIREVAPVSFKKKVHLRYELARRL